VGIWFSEENEYSELEKTESPKTSWMVEACCESGIPIQKDGQNLWNYHPSAGEAF
jgi:hypothetical protein